MRFRFRFAYFLLLLGFVGVLVRLAYLQLWKHNDLLARVQTQSHRLLREAPRRGSIYDREGRALVESVRMASCFADPTLIKDVSGTARALSPLLGLPADTIVKKIQETSGSFVWLKRFMSLSDVQQIEQVGLPGIGLKWEYQRFYPNGNLASNILGFVGAEGRGLSGVEMVFDRWLIDTRPPQHSLRDGRGAGVPMPLQEPEYTENAWVRLTIDRTIQYMAERELESGMKRTGAKTGMIVVQDPRTGEILAIANRPKLDLSDRKIDSTKELSIPPVHWVFEPGSTFKIVSAAAALETGVVRPEETIYCENGSWAYLDVTIHDHSKEKILTFAQVIERSSNIGTAKVALRLGKEKMHEAIRAFGFGALAASEIPGESAGLLDPVSRWSGVTLPMISFGQGIGVTALQMAAAYSVVANNGFLLEPRLFQEARSQNGQNRVWQSPSQIRRVISAKTSERLREILRGVVQRGTGHNALLEGWTVAGKTGTAQKIDPETKKYSADKFVASFCGFAPASSPRLTIVVILDEPQGISWGGYNAGPIFRNVAWHALTYMGVSSDKNETRLAGDREGLRPRS